MKKQQLEELLAEYKEIAGLFKVACEMYKEEVNRLRDTALDVAQKTKNYPHITRQLN